MLTKFLLFLAITAIPATHADVQLAGWYVEAGFTRFDTTIVVPNNIHSGTEGFQAAWPGLEDTAGDQVLQSVIGSFDKHGSEWYVVGIYWCCNPDVSGNTGPNILPGDIFSSSLVLEDDGWHTSWTLSRNSAQIGSDEVTLSPSQYPYPALTRAVVGIELQGDAVFDYGPIEFTNIYAETTAIDDAWCTFDHLMWSNTEGFVGTPSGAPLKAKTATGGTSCKLDSLTISQNK